MAPHFKPTIVLVTLTSYVCCLHLSISLSINNKFRGNFEKTVMKPLQGQAKSRINGALLRDYVGKPVCLLGYASEIDSSGMAFKLKTSDNMIITIHTQEPLQDYIHDLVEIQGIVKSDKVVLCYEYVQFPTEYTQNFDINLYNQAVLVMQRYSEFYEAEKKN